MAERRTRVRFAPSPTGPLHMGGVRTALYNYLYAKQRGGDFVLRIEDTDSHRYVPGSEKYIIGSLRWCGIYPDEGVDADGNVIETPSERHPYAPYRQSQRKEIYRKYAEELIASGKAYYAFDSAEELDARRAECESSGRTFIYNHTTRNSLRNSLTLPEDEVERLLETTTGWTVRFMMPEDRTVAMDDMIRGHMEVSTDTLDDKVLWKRADGLPTYHLANIVDDHLMEITEVIRGEEWLPSLPLHYLLYEAFGWTEAMPRFAHLPLLLKPDGKGKLSKRDGDKLGFPVFPMRWTNPETGEVSRGYKEDGYFPEAFINMLALMGWNPGTEQEIFTLDELVPAFSIDHVVKAGARFNIEKAHWFNREWLRRKDDGEVASLLADFLAAKGLTVTEDGEEPDFKGHTLPSRYLEKVARVAKDRVSFPSEYWEAVPYLMVAPADYGEFGIKAGPAKVSNDPRAKQEDNSATEPFVTKDVKKFWKGEIMPMLEELERHLAAYDGSFDAETFGAGLEEYIKGKEWPMGKVMNGFRLALTGSSSGLGIAEIVTTIGIGEALGRLAFAKSRLTAE